MSKQVPAISEFYKIVDSVSELNSEIFDVLQRDFSKRFQEVRIILCDNDMFANSLMVAIPFGNRVALFYLDQFEKGCVRINFSEARFNNFQEKILSIKV